MNKDRGRAVNDAFARGALEEKAKCVALVAKWAGWAEALAAKRRAEEGATSPIVAERAQTLLDVKFALERDEHRKTMP